MPVPRIFVSSTCYDLSLLRESLRNFLIELGYEPIMSEYSDILYDHRTHTHTSCLNEVPNVDMLVLIIGSRFGGKNVPEALTNIDFNAILDKSISTGIFDDMSKLSITQLEVLKAIETSIPVVAFVEENVWHDHAVYEKNKDLIGKINFPSIDKSETAKYIFEFINFLRLRVKGNSVIPFSKSEDITNYLKKQWALLFQRLLKEDRDREIDNRKMINISEQLDDIKTALLSTIVNSNTKEIAKGIIRYRRLIDFLCGLKFSDISFIISEVLNFQEILDKAEIIEIRDISYERRTFGRTALIKRDGTFFEFRFYSESLQNISRDCDNFFEMSSESRKIIVDTILEESGNTISLLKYREEKFIEYYKNQSIEQIEIEYITKTNED
jgi:hypothetical protein